MFVRITMKRLNSKLSIFKSRTLFFISLTLLSIMLILPTLFFTYPSSHYTNFLSNIRWVSLNNYDDFVKNLKMEYSYSEYTARVFLVFFIDKDGNGMINESILLTDVLKPIWIELYVPYVVEFYNNMSITGATISQAICTRENDYYSKCLILLKPKNDAVKLDLVYSFVIKNKENVPFISPFYSFLSNNKIAVPLSRFLVGINSASKNAELYFELSKLPLRDSEIFLLVNQELVTVRVNRRVRLPLILHQFSLFAGQFNNIRGNIENKNITIMVYFPIQENVTFQENNVWKVIEMRPVKHSGSSGLYRVHLKGGVSRSSVPQRNDTNDRIQAIVKSLTDVCHSLGPPGSALARLGGAASRSLPQTS